jgi:hypothetical protein
MVIDDLYLVGGNGNLVSTGSFKSTMRSFGHSWPSHSRKASSENPCDGYPFSLPIALLGQGRTASGWRFITARMLLEKQLQPVETVADARAELLSLSKWLILALLSPCHPQDLRAQGIGNDRR